MIDNYPYEDLIREDIGVIMKSLPQDEIYFLGDIVKRVLRDENTTRIYVLDVSNCGVAIIKNIYGYSIIPLGEDDGYFFPGYMKARDKVSFVYIMSEALSLLNNIE